MGGKTGKFYRDATEIPQTPPPPPSLFLRQKNITTGAKFHSERNVKTSKIIPSEALSP